MIEALKRHEKSPKKMTSTLAASLGDSSYVAQTQNIVRGKDISRCIFQILYSSQSQYWCQNWRTLQNTDSSPDIRIIKFGSTIATLFHKLY